MVLQRSKLKLQKRSSVINYDDRRRPFVTSYIPIGKLTIVHDLKLSSSDHIT